MRDLWEKTSRHLIVSLAYLLPEPRRIGLNRWLRGREEYRKLRQADYILMSWGKSGRTWLRVMISRFYQRRYEADPRAMLGFDNYKRQNPTLPSIFFTHGNYLRNYTGDWDTKADFYAKKVILLVRDPRDVAVSQFFQWKYRMKRTKKRLNRYPSHGAEVPIFDFVMNPDVGLPTIIGFFNIWAQEIDKTRDHLIIRYEDMRTDTATILGQVLGFLGTPATEAQVRDAVDFAAYDNMKKLEKKKTFRLSGARLIPGDSKNPDSYKVRRAKVGGYRDYFTEEQIEQIETLVHATLSPCFGYLEPAPPASRQPSPESAGLSRG
jgi:hypothetical protein